MPRIECVLFDCDGTLVDSEVLCCQAYVNVFIPYGVKLSLEEVIKNYKGMKLHEIITRISRKHGVAVSMEDAISHYRQEIKRLFDESLQPINGARELLALINVPIAVVSNGPVSKMQQSLGLTNMLEYFGDHLYSGYDLQKWKPDPAVIFYAAEQMQVPVQHCILVEDSTSGVQAGIAAGIPVFYYCADPHNTPIHHPLVTMFTDMRALPQIWREKGWDIAA
ncbi:MULTISPECIES: 6-phosphogluconate phosphatase [unclassified Brenneria]|uniref:6-phosphogluconate phosphatase n=1 Tax=unclassified Brenneria TaxID=2634434 RepID=UPI0029C23FD9|nr:MULTISPECIES: 6-phosphogluconate phosphatase [unclassified Brenneria]MDX5630490.1 6-phosphogluconate phosphatase [Brenneria sp. L3-3Z]MDX5697701.1 6-phosphogluconate phosphatase [Brenneria sp. L4-2C]MEE3662977.1 6-phosphogluconate phosphatase [Brenneria sp. g21c3]